MFNPPILIRSRYDMDSLVHYGTDSDYVQTVLRGDIQTPWALISIYSNAPKSPLYLTSETEEKLKSFGYVCGYTDHFGDYTESYLRTYGNMIPMKYHVFNEEKAKEIINWVDENKNNFTTLYINCDAGISRSGAVGLFLTRYLGFNENEFLSNNPRINPNPLILKILMDSSGLTGDYEKFWENSTIPT